jgi:AAA domain-containing protein
MSDRGIYNLIGKASSAEAPTNGETAGQPVYLETDTVSQILAYQEPPGYNMVGDYHVHRGGMTVLAGRPGVFKTRWWQGLAIQMAKGEGSWFGLKVHGQFRVFVLQAENSRCRLNHDFGPVVHNLPSDIDAWVKITRIPRFGVLMEDPVFRAQLRTKINEFNPHLLVIDPLNSFVPEGLGREVRLAYIWIREVLADCDDPACLIIHHFRKPREQDSYKGRGLLHLLSGSHVLGSVPRTVLALEHASDDPEDHRIVFTCVKNNDGLLGERSAWEMRNGEFHRIEDFDFESFDGKREQFRVTIKDIRAVFSNGEVTLKLKYAMQELMVVTGCGRTAAYEALRLKGRFSAYLSLTRDGELAFSELDPNQQHLELKHDEEQTPPQT